MLGTFGCESTLQFNVISEIETMQVPMGFLKADEMENNVGTMNQSIDTVLE